jgi:hypothetical protein
MLILRAFNFFQQLTAATDRARLDAVRNRP